MEVTYSRHADAKIIQRKIKKSYILKTLSKPHYIKYQITGRNQYFKKFSSLYMKVVAIKLRNNLHVITAHWVVKLPHK